MTRGQQELAVVRNYCEQVMLAKERAEKNRKKRGNSVRVDPEENRYDAARPRHHHYHRHRRARRRS
jgi:hypothetical protein